MTTAAECRNCGVRLAGAYCSACGQKGDVRIPSLVGLLADALCDLFNFDSRIWRSLAALAFKPGRLTRAYVEGRRARYSPPFRMYVVTSVAFFLVFSFVRSAVPPAQAQAEVRDAAAATAVAVEQERAATAPGEATIGVELEGSQVRCKLDKGLNAELRTRLEAACRRIESDSGASFGRAFADNVPVMMLVFIPLVAAIMKVLYVFARRKYVEHLVFFLHLHTFFFLVALLTVAAGYAAAVMPVLGWPARIFGFAAWTYFIVYLFVALRYVYAQGYALTAVKYVVLGASYFFAGMLMLTGSIVYTALTI